MNFHFFNSLFSGVANWVIGTVRVPNTCPWGGKLVPPPKAFNNVFWLHLTNPLWMFHLLLRIGPSSNVPKKMKEKNPAALSCPTRGEEMVLVVSTSRGDGETAMKLGQALSTTFYFTDLLLDLQGQKYPTCWTAHEFFVKLLWNIYNVGKWCVSIKCFMIPKTNTERWMWSMGWFSLTLSCFSMTFWRVLTQPWIFFFFCAVILRKCQQKGLQMVKKWPEDKKVAHFSGALPYEALAGLIGFWPRNRASQR